MNDKTNSDQVVQDYRDIVRDPSCAKKMDPNIRLQVLDHAVRIRDLEGRFIWDVLNLNPDYQYPEGVPLNRLFEYWDEHRQFRHRNACMVIETIESLIAHRNVIDTLEKACGGEYAPQYKAVKAWFIENDLCDPDTFKWTGHRKGGQSDLILYLKDLNVKGYSRHLKQKEIVAIAENSFHFSVNIDTVKRPSPNPHLKPLPFYR